MGGVIRFVFSLIWIALALGVTGNLIDAIIQVNTAAAEVYRNKGVSARAWNSKLSGP